MDLDTVCTTELEALNQISAKLSVIDTWIAYLAYLVSIGIICYIAFKTCKWLITGPIKAHMRGAFKI